MKSDFERIKKEEWSIWKETECYKGFDFRIRMIESYDDKTDAYELQIRNRYFKKAWISYSLTENYNSSKHTTDRTDILPNSVTDASTFFINKGSSPTILIGEVRFVEMDDLSPYYKCDK